jgi:hypothetical protein
VIRSLSCLLALGTIASAPRAGGQAAAVDPFADAPEQDDRAGLTGFRGSALERRAVEAFGPSGRAFPLWVATRRLGPRTLICVRGWEATGTGFGQVGYGVYTPVGGDSVRVVWRGLAAEHSDPGGLDGRAVPRYEIWGCLRVWGERLTYEPTALPPRGRDVGTPPVPAAGVYAWSEPAARFVRVGAVPRGQRGRCRRPAELLPPAG